MTVDRGATVQVGLEFSPETALSKRYVEADVEVPKHIELHAVTSGVMADIVFKVVQAEGPIHGDEITARIRTFWDLQRAGSRIRPAVQRGIDSALLAGAIVAKGEFLNLPGSVSMVRDRSEVRSPSLRRPEMLPPSEIKVAAASFVEMNMGATDEEAITGISRLFGFKATSAQLREVLESAVLEAVTEGLLVRQGNLLRKP